MNDFSKRLRETRKARMLTQEELAEKADISRVMVSRYETSSVIPTVDVLISIADALNVSTDYLLGRAEQFFALCGDASLPDVIHSDSESSFPSTQKELRQFIEAILLEHHLINSL